MKNRNQPILLVENISSDFITYNIVDNPDLKHLQEKSSNNDIFSENLSKDVFIDGVFMQSETMLKNDREYPREEIAREILKKQKDMPYRLPGELNHPMNNNIDLERVAMNIQELEFYKPGEGDTNFVRGKAKITSNPIGENLKKLLVLDGLKVGVSSRGTGIIENKRVKNFNYTTNDIVWDPSAPKAMVDTIIESNITQAYAVEHKLASEKAIKHTKDVLAKSTPKVRNQAGFYKKLVESLFQESIFNHKKEQKKQLIEPTFEDVRNKMLNIL